MGFLETLSPYYNMTIRSPYSTDKVLDIVASNVGRRKVGLWNFWSNWGLLAVKELYIGWVSGDTFSLRPSSRMVFFYSCRAYYLIEIRGKVCDARVGTKVNLRVHPTGYYWYTFCLFGFISLFSAMMFASGFPLFIATIAYLISLVQLKGIASAETSELHVMLDPNAWKIYEAERRLLFKISSSFAVFGGLLSFCELMVEGSRNIVYGAVVFPGLIAKGFLGLAVAEPVYLFLFFMIVNMFTYALLGWAVFIIVRTIREYGERQ